MSAYLDPKPCTECGRVLPRSDFHSNGAGYVAGRCKDCTSARKHAQYARDPRPQIDRSRAWQRRHPEQVAANRRRWVEQHREEQRAYHQEYDRTVLRERRAQQRAAQQEGGDSGSGVDNGVP